MVLPVVMYGCEVWGFKKNNILEWFCLQFYKILLGLKKCTPNCILYGELGRYPIDMFIKCRMIAFWQRIVCNSTGIKLMFVTLVTYIPTWRTRKMVNYNILVFSLFLVYFQILSFKQSKIFKGKINNYLPWNALLIRIFSPTMLFFSVVLTWKCLFFFPKYYIQFFFI
jgi:hypothetical protein